MRPPYACFLVVLAVGIGHGQQTGPLPLRRGDYALIQPIEANLRLIRVSPNTNVFASLDKEEVTEFQDIRLASVGLFDLRTNALRAELAGARFSLSRINVSAEGGLNRSIDLSDRVADLQARLAKRNVFVEDHHGPDPLTAVQSYVDLHPPQEDDSVAAATKEKLRTDLNTLGKALDNRTATDSQKEEFVAKARRYTTMVIAGMRSSIEKGQALFLNPGTAVKVVEPGRPVLNPDLPGVAKVRILSGPLKGKDFFIEVTAIGSAVPGVGEIGVVIGDRPWLAYLPEELVAYKSALESGDKATQKKMERRGRVLFVAAKTTVKVVAQSGSGVRVEVTSGQYKGRILWSTTSQTVLPGITSP